MERTLNETFGLRTSVTEISAPPGLPFYMTVNRQFSNVTIGKYTFLLVALAEGDRFGAVALEKQLVRYMDAANMDAAYAFPALTKIQRDALISRGIPFLCIPEQIYLPFLGILLTNNFKQKRKIAIDHFSPASQCLFLYLLYEAHRNPVLKKDAADALRLTRTSITRASEQLKTLQLISEEPNGKELRMTAAAEGRDYYELGKPYLINPKFRTITVRAETISDRVYAGETALEMQSMLNGPVIPAVALDKKQADTLRLKEVDEKWYTQSPMLQIELWKYDPSLFARNNIVDPVSLEASLRDCTDERVQGELEEYMEKYRW